MPMDPAQLPQEAAGGGRQGDEGAEVENPAAVAHARAVLVAAQAAAAANTRAEKTFRCYNAQAPCNGGARRRATRPS